MDTATIKHLHRVPHEHGALNTRASMQNLLNPEEEDNVLEQINYDHVVHEVASLKVDESREHENQSVKNEERIHTAEQQLHSLAIARAVLERHAPLIVH